MLRGYDQPLYVMPFDHRHSYGEEVFGFHEPMGPDQIAVVADSKQVIYEGFQAALQAGVPAQRSAILVDEEFGTAILQNAKQSGHSFAMPVEKSGQHEFDFEYPDWAKHVEKFDPTFTKVLVRHNPAGDPELNRRQIDRLKLLSDYLTQHKRLFMFELLVPAEKAQLEQCGGDASAYDRQVRPGLMVQAIQQLQDAGVEPDVWKIEGLDQRADCEKIVATIRRDGRQHVGAIVLGRGENEARVVSWLSTAATVPGFTGFAVGRSTFLKSIVDFRAKKIDRAEAVKQIAGRFQEWVKVFESTRGKS